MEKKEKKKRDFKDFSKKEQENIVHNRNNLSNKEIVELVLGLYKKFLPLLLLFIGFVVLGAAAFYYLY